MYYGYIMDVSLELRDILQSNLSVSIFKEPTERVYTPNRPSVRSLKLQLHMTQKQSEIL